MSKEIVKRVKTTDIELKDKLVAVNRVTKVTKGGRHFSYWSSVKFDGLALPTSIGARPAKRIEPTVHPGRHP